jgi:D-glycero-D-manno-heptose 1,7-bisphosphate phosphatase
VTTPAVFLDRDGTLIEDVGYLDRADRLALFPWSIDAVRLLNRGGFRVIIISNQAGVAHGVVDERFVEETHRQLADRFAAAGARIDAAFYCPHHPDAEVERYRQACDCRKPSPGLFRRAAERLSIDLPHSFAVGDRWHDLEAPAALKVPGILVRTGYGASVAMRPSARVAPAHVADNLMEATTWILRKRGS